MGGHSAAKQGEAARRAENPGSHYNEVVGFRPGSGTSKKFFSSLHFNAIFKSNIFILLTFLP
jgi:hypothetical protein